MGIETQFSLQLHFKCITQSTAIWVLKHQKFRSPHRNPTQSTSYMGIETGKSIKRDIKPTQSTAIWVLKHNQLKYHGAIRHNLLAIWVLKLSLSYACTIYDTIYSLYGY